MLASLAAVAEQGVVRSVGEDYWRALNLQCHSGCTQTRHPTWPLHGFVGGVSSRRRITTCLPDHITRYICLARPSGILVVGRPPHDWVEVQESAATQGTAATHGIPATCGIAEPHEGRRDPRSRRSPSSSQPPGLPRPPQHMCDTTCGDSEAHCRSNRSLGSRQFRGLRRSQRLWRQ